MLCYMGHALTDNRHGLVVNAQVTFATATAERAAAGQILADVAGVASRDMTVGTDKNYHTAGFVASCRVKNYALARVTILWRSYLELRKCR